MSEERDFIINDAIHSIKMSLTILYEAGRQTGRQEAAAEFKAKLAGLLDIEGKSEIPDKASAMAVAKSTTHTRATPGSVKPAILKLVQDNDGMTSVEIQMASGIKYNSVRGTLWQLAQEREIEKRGNKWFASSQKDKTVDAGDQPDMVEDDDSPF